MTRQLDRIERIHRPHQQMPLMLFGGGGKTEKKKAAGIGGMMEQFKMVQEMQKKTAEFKEKMSKLKIPGESADGLVKIEMSGEQQIVSCDISDELLGKGADVVGATITEALKDATEKSQAVTGEAYKELMASIGGGAGAPPLPAA